MLQLHPHRIERPAQLSVGADDEQQLHQLLLIQARADINLNYANGQILGGVITGDTIRGPAGIDELMCFVDRAGKSCCA